MRYKTILHIILLFGAISAYGQINNTIFDGSIGDGFDVNCAVQAANNDIFGGSIGDGFDVLCFTQNANNGIFGGSIGDGFDVECVEQESNNGIFGGSIGDGFDVLCAEQESNNTIFGGSIGDGFDVDCAEQESNNGIFGGSIGDGFDVLCFEQTSNNGIFGGSIGDGFDVFCFEQNANNGIFFGSVGDGFDVNCFEQEANNRIFAGSIGDGYTQQCEILNPEPLPVEFLVFDGELLNEDESLLRWVVATEIDNAFFVLERSLDARNFEEVAVIASLGNTTNTREYLYKDYIRPLLGNPVVYYRLKQVDFDESYEYTHVIALNLPTAQETGSYILYPNPAKDRIFIRYANPTATKVQVELFDNLGRQLALRQVDAIDLQAGYPMDLNRLPEGSYHIRIVDGDQISTKTFMKVGY